MAVSDVKFCEAYIPMAKEGKSAADIAKVLEFTDGTKQSAAQKVSQRASVLRSRLKKDAEAAAKTESLDATDTASLVESVVSMLPKLKRSNTAPNLVCMLDEIIAKCDTPE